jgi:hypothetical protein
MHVYIRLHQQHLLKRLYTFPLNHLATVCTYQFVSTFLLSVMTNCSGLILYFTLVPFKGIAFISQELGPRCEFQF